jgi:hypothetical protein
MSFAPKATELPRGNEMTLRAYRDILHCGKIARLCADHLDLPCADKHCGKQRLTAGRSR